jgi:hypothetical protein
MAKLRPVAATLPITQAERDAVRRMAFATDGFEPYPQFIIGGSVLQSLIEKGLVERGESDRPAVAAIGFRLTEIGRTILLRVWPHPEPGSASRATDQERLTIHDSSTVMTIEMAE